MRAAFVIVSCLGALLLAGCPSKSNPPSLSVICIGDGHGGADCVTSAGQNVYKSPTDLLNFWMTTEVDQQNYASWCYGAKPSEVATTMAVMKKNILKK